MSQATYQDAELIMKLYDLRREDRLRAARAWFVGNFSASSMAELMEKYPPGTDHNSYFRMVGSYWDMAASFVVRGVLHEDLFFENSAELLIVWEKTKDLIADMRRVRKNPLLFRNLEKVATRYIEWVNKQAPEAYDGIRAMFTPKK
jgi:hypothetical protein